MQQKQKQNQNITFAFIFSYCITFNFKFGLLVAFGEPLVFCTFLYCILEHTHIVLVAIIKELFILKETNWFSFFILAGNFAVQLCIS